MKLSNDDSIKIKHGKTSKNSGGYYYEGPRGQQLYRDRPETYQQKRSPKQRWNSLAFTYAHQQIRQIWSNQQQIDQVTQEWQAAMRIGPSNQTYPDAKGWKFAMLQGEENRTSFRNLVRTIPRRNIPESRGENCFRGYFRLYASPPSGNPRSTSR